jgi:hypothetical protein
MALYQAVCLKCGAYHEYIRHFSESGDTPMCCNVQTEKRILSAPMAKFDIQPWDAYISPSTGKLISSYAQRKDDMKASGCRDFEGVESEKRQAARNKQYDEEKMDAALDNTVRQAWANLSPAKKALALKGT